MAFRGDEAGASQVVVFIVAGALFVGALGGVLLVAQEQARVPAGKEAADAAKLEVQAGGLIDLLFTPGYTAGGVPWDPADLPDAGAPDLSAEGLGRPGLLDLDGGVSYEKMQFLAQAPKAADGADGLVSYAEASRSLGLEGMDFHVRTWPTLPDTVRLLEAGRRHDNDLGIVYVGSSVPDSGTPNIRFCTMLLDTNGQPVTGTTLPPGTAFDLPMLAAPAGYTSGGILDFDAMPTPLLLNADILAGVGYNGGTLDAACQSYYGLELDGYFYGRSSHPSTTPAGDWLETLYNDFNNVAAGSVDDFFQYSGQIFDSDPGNDDERNTNSDGHILLNAGRPHRTLVAVHRMAGNCEGASPSGDCGEERVVLCHKPGTPAEKTMSVPSSAVGGNNGHLGHGDHLGPCDGAVTCGGDCDGGEPLTKSIGDPVCTKTTREYVVSVAGTNDGSTTTQFNAVFVVDPENGNTHQENANSYLVAPGEAFTLAVKFPIYTTSLCGTGADFTVTVKDTQGVVATKAATRSGNLGGTAVSKGLWLDTTKAAFSDAEAVKVKYGGEGMQNTNPNPLRLRLYNAHHDGTAKPGGGNLLYDQQFTPGNVNSRTRDLGVHSPGEYLAVLSYGTGSGYVESSERVLVVDDADLPLDPFTPLPDPTEVQAEPTVYAHPVSAAAAEEVAYLHATFEDFCPLYFDAAAQSPLSPLPGTTPRCSEGLPHVGDVYPDQRLVLEEQLPLRLLDAAGHGDLSSVRTLVVGSGVAHSLFSYDVVRAPLREWVYAGGNLVVLGSTAQQVLWLQDIFESSLDTDSGALTTPDLGHPLLHVPNDLDLPLYAPPPTSWALDGGSDAKFTKVVLGGSGGSILSVSHGGVFGQGRVILSSWQPHDLLGAENALADLEAQRFLVNLILHGYQDLFLDYGPEIPEATAVIPALRQSYVRHPTLGLVPLTVAVYVFPAGQPAGG